MSNQTGITITRNSKHVKVTPITAEQYLRPAIQYTKSDPVEEFLKQYEQQHNKTSAYNEQLYNSSDRNIKQNKHH